ncbi:MAG: Fe-S cluster assembly ATPase SufC [Robiginitomaculum sp.]|nr:Fe-S cluster assembly ATPase SufC [Robiginitomaculum sp.]
MIEINNLTVGIAGKTGNILQNLSLSIPAGEVHAIMGPNGTGKSTLANVIAGRNDYEVRSGSVLFSGENLLDLAPEVRAAKGVFLSFQYPVEIPGVPVMTFIRAALNAQRKTRGEEKISAPEFLKLIREQASLLKIKPEMLKRAVNVGFSGGEKKRLEILQMAMLQPKFMVLDETDSGLDIDALKVVADGVNSMRGADRSMLVITHYQRLLDYIKPDRVHVMTAGKIVKSGGPELALDLEKNGYDQYIEAAA